jgi:hypothetical protein
METIRAVSQSRRYKTARHRISGLPVMVAVKPPKRRVTAAEIARLQADLL